MQHIPISIILRINVKILQNEPYYFSVYWGTVDSHLLQGYAY